MKDFAITANSGGGFKFDARSDRGETFAWSGTLGMAPMTSKGDFRTGILQLATSSRFAGDLLLVSMSAGTIYLAGSYGRRRAVRCQGGQRHRHHGSMPK